MLRTTLISALALSLAAGAALADITNITQGTTHPTIQDAIDQSVDGDEIVVDPGEYFENLDLLGRQITLRSQDPTDPATVIATIINGSSNGEPTITCENGETAGTLISGFVITGGEAYLGGGLLIWADVSPKITYCSITGNVSTMHGGGAFISGSPTFANCSFSHNSAPGAGGGVNVTGGEPTFTNCSFTNNSASGGGGFFTHNARATLTNCSFANNEAQSDGGGMFAEGDGGSSCTRCSFTNNVAGADGGGVYDAAGGFDDPGTTYTDCSFTNNSADEYGGGMFVNDYIFQVTTVVDCSFTSNIAGISGGGISLGEDQYLTLTFTDSVVCGNMPDQVDGSNYTDGGGNAIGIYIPPPAEPPAPCPEDINGDGVIDQADLGALLAMYGQTCP